MALLRVATLIIVSAIPLGLAVWIDHDFSSAAHLPVIGVSGICVSLCDALCGQIISNTRWIPFSASHTPAEAQCLVRAFRKYHRDMILSWMTAKITSAIVIMLSAVMALQQCPSVFVRNRVTVFVVGYFLLGISICMAIRFILSYFSASDESDRARLEEMNYAYKKDHPEPSADDRAALKRQLAGFAPGYTSTPSTAIIK